MSTVKRRMNIEDSINQLIQQMSQQVGIQLTHFSNLNLENIFQEGQLLKKKTNDLLDLMKRFNYLYSVANDNQRPRICEKMDELSMEINDVNHKILRLKELIESIKSKYESELKKTFQDTIGNELDHLVMAVTNIDGFRRESARRYGVHHQNDEPSRYFYGSKASQYYSNS